MVASFFLIRRGDVPVVWYQRSGSGDSCVPHRREEQMIAAVSRPERRGTPMRRLPHRARESGRRKREWRNEYGHEDASVF